MQIIRLSKKEAKNFLVTSHLLSSDKLSSGEGSVTGIINHFKAVQVDSISVAGTNQDIIFNSRCADYTSSQLDNVLYRKREAFETYLKSLCILPIESFPYYLVQLKKWGKANRDFANQNKSLVKSVLKTLEKEGPMSSSDFEDAGKVPGYWTGEVSLVKRILEVLWESGELIIHHRKGRQRYYDITDRCINVERKKVTEKEFYRKAVSDICTSLRLISLIGGTGEIWWGYRGVHKNILTELESEGELVPVSIEGSKRPFLILKSDLKLLDNPVAVTRNVRLIAPLDSITWDRKMVQDVFGFLPTFEVYKPPQTRTYGYYCVFVLYGNDFVGRCDIAKDRKASEMVLNSIHWEPGFKVSDDFLTTFSMEIIDYCRFLGMKHVRLLEFKFDGRGKLLKLIKSAYR